MRLLGLGSAMRLLIASLLALQVQRNYSIHTPYPRDSAQSLHPHVLQAKPSASACKKGLRANPARELTQMMAGRWVRAKRAADVECPSSFVASSVNLFLCMSPKLHSPPDLAQKQQPRECVRCSNGTRHHEGRQS